MDSLFTLADSFKPEVPSVSLVARPYTPNTARQVSKTMKERADLVKRIKEKNLKEEAALQTGRLYVQMADRNSAVKSKEGLDSGSNKVPEF